MSNILLFRHFAAVAEAQSFTRAAQAMGVSQSVISRSVQSLEDWVGAKLFQRDTRNLALTEAGLSLLVDGQAILNRFDLATDNARRIGLGDTAELTLGICPSVEGPALVEAITRFRSEWPTIELKVKVVEPLDQLAGLRSSSISLGVMPIVNHEWLDIKWRTLSRPQVTVGVPSMWNVDQSGPIDLADLKDQPWLIPDPQLAPVLYAAAMKLFEQADFHPEIAGVADSVVKTRILVGCGVGAAFLRAHGASRHFNGIDILELRNPDLMLSEVVGAWSVYSTSPLISALMRCLEKAFALVEN